MVFRISLIVGWAAVLGLPALAAAQERNLPLDLASDAPVGLRGRNQEDQAPPETRARSEERLARELQNPVADLISVPLQSDFDCDLAPDQAGFRYTMNLQPVVPFDLGEDWLLITRTTVPVTYQFDVRGEDTGSEFGLGDILQSFFISPKGSSSEGVHLGIGPAFLWPTATRDALGTEKWGVGPSGVVVLQSRQWTVGVLTNHVWSYAGADSRPDVNQTFVQPFVAMTLSKGTTFNLTTEATFDWDADQWTVPLIGGVSQVMKFGDQPVSIGVLGKYWVEGPSSAPDWGVRFFITLIFPR
jgi:hypothetical protein